MLPRLRAWLHQRVWQPQRRRARSSPARRAHTAAATAGTDVPSHAGRSSRRHGLAPSGTDLTRLVRINSSHHDNDDLGNGGFVSNRISNTRYTLYSFLPLNLSEQLSQNMNRYFLLIACLQLWPAVTPVSPVTTWLPLIVIFLITAVKDAIDDYRRHVADKRANQRRVTLLRGSHRGGSNDSGRVSVAAQDIVVGDLVLVPRDGEVPCDLMLLTVFASSSSSSSSSSPCFIETSNIDGESSLKERVPLPVTASLSESQLCELTAVVECAMPNGEIYQFDSTLTVHASPSSSRSHAASSSASSLSSSASPTYAVSSNQLLPAATFVRNTHAIVGVCVYTGADTKLAQNKTVCPHVKRSKLDMQINTLTSYVFATQLTLAVLLGGYGSYWQAVHGHHHWYLSLTSSSSSSAAPPTATWLHAIIVVLRFLLLCSMMIPISLKVTLDIVKLVYAHFIDSDQHMYDAARDTPAHATSTVISEDLGQVQYVFADKTGTLTNNQMHFRSCAVFGRRYGCIGGSSSSSSDDRADVFHGPLPHDIAARGKLACSTTAADSSAPVVSVGDSSASGAATSNTHEVHSVEQCATDAVILLRAMAVCNSVLVVPASTTTTASIRMHIQRQQQPQLSLPPTQFEYITESPDERALVMAARRLNFTLTHRDGGTAVVSEPVLSRRRQLNNADDDYDGMYFDAEDAHIGDDDDDGSITAGSVTLTAANAPGRDDTSPRHQQPDDNQQQYQRRFVTLAVCHFTSDRKRMSVLVRDMSANRVILFTKGADNVVFARLRQRRGHPDTSREGHDHDVDKMNMHAAAVNVFFTNVVSEYACAGLRTMCFAYRCVSERECVSWLQKYQRARACVTDREAQLSAVYELLEVNLRLVGVVGIEDELQEVVPHTIYTLRRAGIRVWMVTGDKQETARQVASTCRLITALHGDVDDDDHDNGDGEDNDDDASNCAVTIAMDDRLGGASGSGSNVSVAAAASTNNELLSLTGDDVDEIVRRVHEYSRIASSPTSSSSSPFSLIVDGDALAVCLRHCRTSFTRLALAMQSVVCCRVSPQQKADVVLLVKQAGHVTLAIGDGGNDVAMIEAANVGVGISGSEEGQQAARAADFTIARFRFLARLLLVHGRWSYMRSAHVALYSFYKSLFICLVQLLFATVSAASGASFVDSFSLVTYNMCYTGLPIIFHVLHRDVASAHTLTRQPHLYAATRTGTYFTLNKVRNWACRGLYQAVVVVVVTLLTSHGGDGGTGMTSSASALADGQRSTAFVAYSVAVYVQTLTMLWESVIAGGITLPSGVVVIATQLLFFALNAYVGGMPAHTLHGVFATLVRDPVYWLRVVLMIVLAFLPVLTAHALGDATLIQTARQHERELTHGSHSSPSLRRRRDRKSNDRHGGNDIDDHFTEKTALLSSSARL